MLVEVKDRKVVQAVNNLAKLEIVDASEVRIGKSKGGNGTGRYAKYSIAIGPHVPWIKEQIDSSEDGKIRVRVKDLTKAMGPDFVKRSATAIYWGLKYSLFKERIVVTTGKTIAGDDVLYLSHAGDKDELPPSLQKEFIKELDLQAKSAKNVPKPEAPKVEISKTTTEWVVKHDTKPVVDAPKPKIDKGRLITAIRLSDVEAEDAEESGMLTWA